MTLGRGSLLLQPALQPPLLRHTSGPAISCGILRGRRIDSDAIEEIQKNVYPKTRLAD